MNKIEGDLKYLLHSLCHMAVIEKINTEINSYTDFINDYFFIDVIVLRLQQIGELITRFSSDFKSNHSEIDFINIKGLRNIVVHNYDGLDYEDIYVIIKEDIPDLKAKYEKIVINEFNLSKEFVNDYVNNYIENRIYKDIL